jgi:ribosome maturation factor RimP
VAVVSGRGRSSGRPGASRTSRDAASRGGAHDGGARGGRRYAGREPGVAARPGGATLDLAARRERVREVVEPVVTAAGYDLEELVLSRAGRRQLVRVVVDGDGGVSLDDIADVSRAVSAALDAAEEVAGELFAGEYALEVGSPGVDRPLTLPRHWRRNVSRLVAVQIRSETGDRQVTGRVLGADDEGIVLDVSGVPREVAYGQLGPGRVQIEFTRWGAVDEADLREVGDPSKDPADAPDEDPDDDPDELDDEDLEEER